jgi:hypothetical protein
MRRSVRPLLVIMGLAGCLASLHPVNLMITGEVWWG